VSVVQENALGEEGSGVCVGGGGVDKMTSRCHLCLKVHSSLFSFDDTVPASAIYFSCDVDVEAW
jgi:hypothetical protein